MTIASSFPNCPRSPKNGEIPLGKGSHRSSDKGLKMLDHLPKKRGTRDMITMNIDYGRQMQLLNLVRLGLK